MVKSSGSSSSECVRGLYERMRPYIPLLATWLIAILCIVRGMTIGEFDFNIDEPDHAATGLYFHDLLLDHPVTHPVEYTYLYYAHYPSLGLIHWPPFFHFCEGVMFLLFQPSVVTARVTILLFALLGLYFWLRFVSELHGPWIGGLATLFLALAPGVLLYEKVVMLEVPSLALCIAASYFWFLPANGREQGSILVRPLCSPRTGDKTEQHLSRAVLPSYDHRIGQVAPAAETTYDHCRRNLFVSGWTILCARLQASCWHHQQRRP